MRIHGSHHIYSKEGTVNRLSIPIHGNASLKIGLLRHFLDLAGLSKENLK
ncbi:MAG: type II toxin-antitoxin system HicA family toxin [bacterium]